MLPFTLGVCSSAFAGGHYDGHGPETFETPEAYYSDVEDEAFFGIVTHHNQWTIAEDKEFYSFDTPHGEVTFRLVRTPNNEDDPSDTLEAVNLPPNVLAIPSAITTPEKSLGHIKLFYYLGG